MSLHPVRISPWGAALLLAAVLSPACGDDSAPATPFVFPTAATSATILPDPPIASPGPETTVVTAVPGTATPSPAPTAAPGARGNPIPAGEPAALGDGWTLAVVGTIPNATDVVLAENQFNERPEPGEQFFIVGIAATFDGAGSEELQASLRLRLVGDSAVAYTTFNDSCGVIPHRLPETEVFEGGTVTGNLCWSVKSSDIGSLVLYDDSADVGTLDRIFFALDQSAGPTPAPAATGTALPERPGTVTLSDAAGTREDPVPLGEAAALGDGWTVVVTGTTPDGTAAVLAENQFNEPPAEGEQFFIVAITATYEGTGSRVFDGSFRFAVVGDSAVGYTTFEHSCGVIPGDLPTTEVFQGGTVTGNLCWAVRASDVGSLLLFDDSFLADGPGVFFSLER